MKDIPSICRDLTTQAWEQDPKGLDLNTFLDTYKVCSLCNSLLLHTQFAVRYNKRSSYCRDCGKRQLNEAIYMRMVFVLSYAKTMGCIDCGEKDPIVLEYDHVRGDKFERIAQMVHEAYSVERLLAEIAKCEVVCRNCHRRRTIQQLGWHTGNPSNCKNKRKAELYYEKEEFIRDYLREHPCVDCGESDPFILEFDHVRGIKLYSVSRMRPLSKKKIQAEIDKCEVRCCNCHRRKSARDQECYKGIDVPNLPELDLTKPLETYLPKKNRWDGRKKP